MHLSKRMACILLLTSHQVAPTLAFSTPNTSIVGRTSSSSLPTSSSSYKSSSFKPLYVSNNRIPPELPIGGIGPEPYDGFQKYSEESRKYRRTVYTHEEWVRHRESDRFFRNLNTFLTSGIYRSLFKEVASVTSIATFVVAWNCLFGEYQDLKSITHEGIFHGVLPLLQLPLAAFTLSSPSLGLLLVFRTNSAYKRWDEARKNWGMNINHTRDLVRMGNAYYDRQAVSPEQAKADLETLALNTWCFVRCMKRHLSPEWEDEGDFRRELLEKLPKQQAQAIFNAAHRPNRALQDLSTSIENLPMHFMRRNEIHAAATIFEDNLGSSERILTSPIPLFYSTHTARILSVWLLFLPLALWSPLQSWNHVALIPAVAMLSTFLLGIEELATQLEEPFTILPMQGFCDKIYNWVTEIASFEPGSNGMPVYYYKNDERSLIAQASSSYLLDEFVEPSRDASFADTVDTSQISIHSNSYEYDFDVTNEEVRESSVYEEELTRPDDSEEMIEVTMSDDDAVLVEERSSEFFDDSGTKQSSSSSSLELIRNNSILDRSVLNSEITALQSRISLQAIEAAAKLKEAEEYISRMEDKENKVLLQLKLTQDELKKLKSKQVATSKMKNEVAKLKAEKETFQHERIVLEEKVKQETDEKQILSLELDTLRVEISKLRGDQQEVEKMRLAEIDAGKLSIAEAKRESKRLKTLLQSTKETLAEKDELLAKAESKLLLFKSQEEQRLQSIMDTEIAILKADEEEKAHMKETLEIAKLKAKQEESRHVEIEQELDRIKVELKKVSQNMKKSQDLDHENKKLHLNKESNTKPLSSEEDKEMELFRIEKLEEEVLKDRELAAERQNAAIITEKKQRSLLAARLEMEKYLKEVAIAVVELQISTKKAEILKEMNQRSLLRSRLRLDAQEKEATKLKNEVEAAQREAEKKEREKTRQPQVVAIQNENVNESAEENQVSVSEDSWDRFYVKELE